jgi:1-hydroxycarotenoid 3,4-desaturase
MASERVIVVGAGVGGLAAALSLAAHGVEVLVIERAGTPGGKLREVTAGGQAMDAGPTVFTMRWVFEELFGAAGARLEDLLPMRPVTTLARHAWNEAQRLDLYADIDRSEGAICEFAGVREAQRFRQFCARAERIYRTLQQPFLRHARPTPVSLAMDLGLSRLPALIGISPFSTLWRELGQHFHDPRLRQLFGRYATYCGSSPWRAPATLMLVAHVEREGVWLVEGGMHRIALALAELAAKHGALLRLGCDVQRLLMRDGRVGGVGLASGETLEASAVVFNGDVAALPAGKLGEEARHAVVWPAGAQRSLSALTWNLLARPSGFPLLRHNVFFSSDYEAEFNDLFGAAQLPGAPTVYVCAQDRRRRSDHEDWPHGNTPERLLCLVNAPPNGDRHTFSAEENASCEQRMSQRLAICGLQLNPIAPAVVTTPNHFEQLFPATGGALYGLASHGWRSAFERPGSSTRLPGLYLAGGSVHPGPGVPMAALSGQLAAHRILADRSRNRVSTARSQPAATPGGTWTR